MKTTMKIATTTASLKVTRVTNDVHSGNDVTYSVNVIGGGSPCGGGCGGGGIGSGREQYKKF